MVFVTVATLTNQTLVITPRNSGQVVRFGGVDISTTAETPVRVHGSGVVQLGPGWWDELGVFDGDYRGPWFDGSQSPGPGRLIYHWNGEPNNSTSTRELDYVPGARPTYCNVDWFADPDECPNLYDMLNPPYYGPNDPSTYVPWEAQYIQQDAPWAAESFRERSAGFLGVYALSVSNLADSTRSSAITEGITDGGVIERARSSVPRLRFRVLLTALDEDALEYGTAWLNRVLEEKSCSAHGHSCGSTDITFLTACPPPVAAFVTPDDRLDPEITYSRMARSYHDVKVVEPPVVVEEFNRNPNSWGRIMEFTLAAGVPALFGTSVRYEEGREIDPGTSYPFTDMPRNVVIDPSAEVAGPAVVVATNYALNPSVEVDATGWSTQPDGTGITAAMVTSGRVTGELSASGPASFRAVFTATGAGASGTFAVQQEVAINTRPAGARVSVNMWAAALKVSGTVTIADIEFTVYWRASAGGTVLSQETIGVAPISGGAASKRSLVVPAGATHALVRATARLTSWSTGTVVRLYGDAAAVTVP